jgi:hypothetical protein
VAEPFAVNKPRTSRARARPLAELLARTLNDAFARRGFASAELVTRWTEIVGAEIAAHSQPEKIQWLRTAVGQSPEPGVLVLRVEGPTAVEIQHLSAVVIERVNRFFGWQAIGSLRLRQAPLRRRDHKPLPTPDAAAVARVAATLPQVADERLRDALARLGAAIKPA